MTKVKLRGRDTPPIHRRYRWWRGMLKGAVAGTSPMGHRTDGRTGVRTLNNDERHPWRIPLDRPCLLCFLMQKWLCVCARPRTRASHKDGPRNVAEWRGAYVRWVVNGQVLMVNRHWFGRISTMGGHQRVHTQKRLGQRESEFLPFDGCCSGCGCGSSCTYTGTAQRGHRTSTPLPSPSCAQRLQSTLCPCSCTA